MFVNILYNIYKVKYLIDLEVKENFILQFFVKNAQLFKDISLLLQIQIFNNYIVVLYKTQKFFIVIVNSKKIYKSNCSKFYIINIQNYKIIFKLF